MLHFLVISWWWLRIISSSISVLVYEPAFLFIYYDAKQIMIPPAPNSNWDLALWIELSKVPLIDINNIRIPFSEAWCSPRSSLIAGARLNSARLMVGSESDRDQHANTNQKRPCMTTELHFRLFSSLGLLRTIQSHHYVLETVFVCTHWPGISAKSVSLYHVSFNGTFYLRIYCRDWCREDDLCSLWEHWWGRTYYCSSVHR